jgi:predicted phosphoribosyltransferase
MICPWRPPLFGAVSAFYRSFPQVDDEEVARLLQEADLPQGL